MSVTHQMKEFLFSSLFTTILAIHPTISMQQRLRLIYVVQHMKKKTTALILEFFLSFDSLIFGFCYFFRFLSHSSFSSYLSSSDLPYRVCVCTVDGQDIATD